MFLGLQFRSLIELVIKPDCPKPDCPKPECPKTKCPDPKCPDPKACQPGTYQCAVNDKGASCGWNVCDVNGKWVVSLLPYLWSVWLL